MTNFRTITVLSLACLFSLALSVCQAKDVASQQQPTISLASRLVPQSRSRSARSLSDMFEKVKSKLFGGKKQQQANNNNPAMAQSVTSAVSSAQRQPWGDVNSFNQQYNPYASLSNYQWPASSNGQYLGNQYAQLGSYPVSSYQGLNNAAQPQGASSGSIMQGLDIAQSQLSPSVYPTSSGTNNGGLFSSASHLIAQYLSPNPSSSQQVQQMNGFQQPNQQSGIQGGFNGQSLLSPQQQTQYNEFASILDSMVAQTGAGSPQRSNQVLNNGSLQANQTSQASFQSGPNMMGMSDNDMVASSNVQSYLPQPAASPSAPSAGPQPAISQKSSMVSLAEQLAPGSQFNKLISFPFSLSNNDDPSKEGRFKVHIPFVNQHVKRSDQSQKPCL